MVRTLRLLTLSALLAIAPLAAIAQSLAPPLFRCEFAPGSGTPMPPCEDRVRALHAYWSAAIAAGAPFARVDVLGAIDPREARRDPTLARRRAVAVGALLVGVGFAPERLSVETSALEEAVVLMDPHGIFRCLFAPGSATVTPTCATALRGVVAMVGDHPAAQRCTLMLDVNGFTDDREARTASPGLAMRRAEAVVQALRALGLRTQALNARGHGPDGAARPTNRPDARERAVSIVVVPRAGDARR